MYQDSWIPLCLTLMTVIVFLMASMLIWKFVDYERLETKVRGCDCRAKTSVYKKTALVESAIKFSLDKDAGKGT